MNLPNALTVLRILLAPVFFFCQLTNTLWGSYAAAGVFITAAVTDLLDGYFARKFSDTTSFGKFMDPLADKILVAFAFIAFLDQDYVHAWMVGLIIFREFFITGVRMLAVYEDGSLILPTVTAKLKTVFQMSSIAVILTYQTLRETLLRFQNFDIYTLEYSMRVTIDILMIVTTFLTLWTGVLYVVRYFPTLRKAFRVTP